MLFPECCLITKVPSDKVASSPYTMSQGKAQWLKDLDAKNEELCPVGKSSLFIITKTRMQPRRPAMGEWINGDIFSQ